MLHSERELVAAAARGLARDGLALGTSGNVSWRAGELVAITATGAMLERVTAEEVVVVALDGTLVEGEFAPTSELELHLGAYRRFQAGAVVHTHGPAATALGCVRDELPVIHYQLLELGGAIRVAPYATFGTTELARMTLDALDGRRAAIMANHGAVTIGHDLDAALAAARLLEWGADLYLRASAIGEPRTLNDGQITDFHRVVAERAYGPLVRASP